jgi:hypothetical protein
MTRTLFHPKELGFHFENQTDRTTGPSDVAARATATNQEIVQPHEVDFLLGFRVAAVALLAL